MEWSKCKTLKLIELYEQETVLWSITDAQHKNSNNRLDALKRIADAFDDATVEEVDKKLHGLRSQYMREKTKIEKSKKSGAGAKDVYKPKWQYFLMLSFLSSTMERVAHISSINVSLNDTTQELENVNEDQDPDDITMDAQEDDIVIAREPAAPEPIASSVQQEKQPGKKQPNKRPLPPSKISGLEKKINKAYEVLTTSVSNSQDVDACFGKYVGESLKKFQDRKTKAWIRHSISNILYQAEYFPSGTCPPPINDGHNNYYRQQQYHQQGGYSNSCSSSSTPLPSPQGQTANTLHPLSPVEKNQPESYTLMQNMNFSSMY